MSVWKGIRFVHNGKRYEVTSLKDMYGNDDEITVKLKVKQTTRW